MVQTLVLAGMVGFKAFAHLISRRFNVFKKLQLRIVNREIDDCDIFRPIIFGLKRT